MLFFSFSYNQISEELNVQLNTVVQVEFHHFGPQIGPSCKSSRVPYNDVTIKYSVNKWFSYSIFTAAEKATIITGIILTVAVIIIIRHIMRLCYCHVTDEGLSAEGGHSTAASSQSQSRLLIHLLIHLDKEGRACSCKRTNPVTSHFSEYWSESFVCMRIC